MTGQAGCRSGSVCPGWSAQRKGQLLRRPCSRQHPGMWLRASASAPCHQQRWVAGDCAITDPALLRWKNRAGPLHPCATSSAMCVHASRSGGWYYPAGLQYAADWAMQQEQLRSASHTEQDILPECP
jgi:hypothetical protein